ncbi:MAG: CPBP family intramembrane metalloprotease [Candidatus Omnitrophica bacterium]|nr:CPBP family intramembrane metalloprotease [Candidatus Omnitrophota bacterium]
MSKVFKFFVIVIIIFVLSVLLTPLVHALLNPYFKFERIFNRLVMIFTVAAAALYVLRGKGKREGLFDREAWREYGFDFSRPWKRLIQYGFLTGALTVVILAIVEVAIGPRYLREPFLLQDIVERFFKGMLSGLVVGIVEEFFFRGFIYVNLTRKIGSWLAVILGSAFYSLCHFFDNGQIFIPENPSFGDAIRLMFGYLEPFVKRPHVIFPEFAGLFLFGVLLNLAFIRTRSIFLSIGVHAGAVFMVKWQYSFVRSGPEDMLHPFFGHFPYYDGRVEWFVLVLLGCVVWWMAPRLSRS